MASVQRTGGPRSVRASGAASSGRQRRTQVRNAANRFLASLLLLGAGVVAAASQGNAPREYLDEETGATVFFVGQPLLFGRERVTVYGEAVQVWPVGPPDLAPAPRDYVSLAAAAVDHSGKYTYVLFAYAWFVGAPQPDEKVCLDPEHLVLQLADRRIELAPFAGSARQVGIREPIHPPWTGAKPAIYNIDLATLGLIAESAHLVLYCGTGTPPLKYELWEDRLPALKELVRNLSD